MTPTTRFEVFKRDAFTCQYCGQRAPEVVLECDHIKPVKLGGDDSPLNLITSCFSCNRGKGARPLSDQSKLAKSHKQAELLQEKREQLRMIAQWHSELQELGEQQADVMNDAWSKGLCNHYELNENGRRKARKLIQRFGLAETLEAMAIALNQYPVADAEKGFTKESVDEAFNKIGGIAYNRSQQKESQ